MATENQNFFKHYKDTFAIVFTVTDVNDDLSSYYGFWAAATTPTSSFLVSKSTADPFTGAADVGGIDITGQTITVQISQSDFIQSDGDTDKLYTGSFYHELTIGALQNGDDSVVVASGEMTIKEDLFNFR